MNKNLAPEYRARRMRSTPEVFRAEFESTVGTSSFEQLRRS